MDNRWGEWVVDCDERGQVTLKVSEVGPEGVESSQFALPPAEARRVGEALIDFADSLDG